MITKEFLEDICFITQHDHARVSLDLFLMINPEIKQGLEELEELKNKLKLIELGRVSTKIQ